MTFDASGMTRCLLIHPALCIQCSEHSILNCFARPKKLRANAKNLYAAAYSGEVEKVLAILRKFMFLKSGASLW